MITRTFVIKGDICFSKSVKELCTYENHYLICEDGKCKGIHASIPEQYKEVPIHDYTGQLVLPGLIDLHVHASQYAFRGIGMDLGLLDWLEQRTFPEESKFKNMEYAKEAYSIFAQDLLHSATTRAVIFATIHTDATMVLMDCMEKTGLKTYVGKVNMDRNSPRDLMESSVEDSAKETIRWLQACKNLYTNTKPILTPRFIPSCTDELMQELKQIQLQYDLPLQSHLSEARDEIEWVSKLCPESKFYGDAYDRFGLFGGEVPTIMAHCVSSTEDEIKRIKERGVYIAHCPQSNTNLSSGIAPIRHYMKQGLNLGLGSDVAAGTTESIFQAMADAISVSKLRWRYVDQTLEPLHNEEVFYLGTKGGGAFFGAVGSFEENYEFDAIVMDDRMLRTPQPLSLKERLERIIYLSQQCKVAHKYVSGNQLF